MRPSPAVAVGVLWVFLASCSLVDDDLKTGARVISGVDVADKAYRARQKITREDEYYLGRAAAAGILALYPVYDDDAATRYLGLVGQSLALESNHRPFDGFRFVILDSDDVNAFATPGAFVFVSRGLLRLTRDEDMLAAVLAHEIAHVERHDARELIQDKRWKRFWKAAVTATFVSYTPEVLGKLAPLLGAMGSEVFVTVHDKGYERERDRGADHAAVGLLRQVGYDPHALIDVLRAVASSDKSRGRRFIRTHAKPKERIQDVRRLISGEPERHAGRARRFEAALERARAR